MFVKITKSLNILKKSMFAKSSPTLTIIDETFCGNAELATHLHQESWYGMPLPAGYQDENKKTIYRKENRKEILRGCVVAHVPHGVLIAIASGEAGLVTHAELDWSPKRGRKYFPVGSEHDVMILSRSMNNRLYLSIRKANFPEYFKECIKDMPIGLSMMCRIEAIKDYGFFVTVKENIDVFFHKSMLANFESFKLHDLVEIKITGYDYEHHRLLADLA